MIEYFLHLSLTNEENFIHTGSGDTSQPTLWFVQDTLATRQIIVYHILMNINKHTVVAQRMHSERTQKKCLYICSYYIFSLNKITSVHDDRLVRSLILSTSISWLSSVESQCSMLIMHSVHLHLLFYSILVYDSSSAM